MTSNKSGLAPHFRPYFRCTCSAIYSLKTTFSRHALCVKRYIYLMAVWLCSSTRSFSLHGRMQFLSQKESQKITRRPSCTPLPSSFPVNLLTHHSSSLVPPHLLSDSLVIRVVGQCKIIDYEFIYSPTDSHCSPPPKKLFVNPSFPYSVLFYSMFRLTFNPFSDLPLQGLGGEHRIRVLISLCQDQIPGGESSGRPRAPSAAGPLPAGGNRTGMAGGTRGHVA